MGELFLPIGIMVFTVVVAFFCLQAAKGVMTKREKIIQGWLKK